MHAKAFQFCLNLQKILFFPLQSSLPSPNHHFDGSDGTDENAEQYTFCVDEENVVVTVFYVKGGIPFSTPAKPCPCGYYELMRSCCSLNGEDRPAFTGTHDVCL